MTNIGKRILNNCDILNSRLTEVNSRLTARSLCRVYICDQILKFKSMKKLVLSLALAAFIGGGTLFAFATSDNSTESVKMEMIQDGKKKSKATKKDDCKKECSGDKSSAKKDDCKGNDVLKKKSCCSDGKAAKTSKSQPEKK